MPEKWVKMINLQGKADGHKELLSHGIWNDLQKGGHSQVLMGGLPHVEPSCCGVGDINWYNFEGFIVFSISPS